MSQDKGTVTVVLGMHRSVTSAITKALEIFGVDLGDDLLKPMSCNEKGFWEDASCVEINEKLLQHYNASYHKFNFDLTQLDFSSNSNVMHLKRLAVRLVLDRLKQGNGEWGLKDPRLCRLLPFWKEVFGEIGCKVKYVIAIRNPMNVAASLLKRDNFPVQKSYYLWLRHLLPVLKETENELRVIVDFDSLLECPIEQVCRIASALSFDIPRQGDPTLNVYIDEFLDNRLRHTKFSIEELESDSFAPSEAITLYKMLARVAQDKLQLNDIEAQLVIESLKQKNNTLTPALDCAEYLQHKLDEARGEFFNSIKRSAELTELLAESNLNVNNLKSDLYEKNIQENKLKYELQSALDDMLCIT